MKNWIEVKAVFASPQDDWSPVTEVFDRHGCPGTMEQETPPALISYLAEVEGAEYRLACLRAELLDFGARSVETAVVPEQDWSENWKQFFKTRRVGRILIRPTWEPLEFESEDVVVSLDPGQAFGTGDHPTTRLCLLLMQKLELSGTSVADIGCGSGILAIAANKLGANVAAYDIDAQSVEIAKENSHLNEVDFAIEVASGFEKCVGSYDLVLSNIISAVLIQIAPDAWGRINPGGHWIVSGIIAPNWEALHKTVVSCGFKLIEKKQEDDWIGATFRR